MSGLSERLLQIGRPRILVLGDLMLDRYTWGDAERVSPEAPVIVLRADQEEIRPGGAASVAYLLRHLDADVWLAGVIGDDADGHTLRALLRDEGIHDEFVLVDPTRCTTSKQRFVGKASDRHPHQILRVDRECRDSISEQLARDLWGSLKNQISRFDAILIADYLKGVCDEHLLQDLITAARQQRCPVLVDPGRIANYDRYRGASLLKPNRLETELATGVALSSSESALQAGRKLCRSLGITAAVITLDRDGLVITTLTEHTVVPTTPRAVYDITGAGDMVLATLGLCFAHGIEASDAACLANIAAGLEVERFGIAPVSRAEIHAKLHEGTNSAIRKRITIDEAIRFADECRREGKRIVFTNGCFDLLHVGHLASLEEARQLGDVLIVAINSDASVKRLKGPGRPVITESARARMLTALECVHRVLIFEDDTPEQLIRAIRPDVLVKGGTTEHLVGGEFVKSYGGVCCRTSCIEGVSTTVILSSMVSDLSSSK